MTVTNASIFPAALPVPAARFVGRQAEMTQLEGLLRRPDIRLLTLVGVGGSGKTRLALEAVGRFTADRGQQVAFVDLAPLTASDLVGKAIAQSLGLRDAVWEGDLVYALQEIAWLLVLDNFEHVLDAASLVFDLLSRCPLLRIVVTSRAVLGVRGEHVFSVHAMQQDQCVELFLDRASAADSNFSIALEDEPTLAEICRRVDGLPLAIELAAARVRVLPPRALLTRLESRLGLLTGGGPDRPVRHQTLRNTIEWSCRLLRGSEQTLFRRLAVFRGGWSLGAAVSVVADTDIDALTRLASLVDKSLIEPVPTSSGDARFRMLETIREYALQLLFLSGETDDVMRSVIRYLIRLCESEVGNQRGGGQAAWFGQLDLELDNIRAALAWTLQAPDGAELGLHLAALLHNFWKEGAHWSEGRLWLERALARAEKVDPAVLAHGLTVAGDLAYLQNDSARARECLEWSIVLWRQQDPCQWLATSLRLMARIAIGDGQLALARSLCAEALAAANEAGVRVETGLALNVMGMVDQSVGDLAGAMARYEEGLRIMRALGDLPGTAFILWEIGQVAELQGELDRASAVFAQGLAVSQQAGDRKEAARCLLGLARVALRGDTELDTAESLALRSMDLFRAMGADREIEQAQALVASIRSQREGKVRVRARRSDGLTAREAQIVTLIAEGATNSAIGSYLALSVRTVERHIENIYAKLGVQGRTARAAVAGYAVRSEIDAIAVWGRKTTRPHG
jgi:non-specific serine/threonine protein kinase